MKLHSGIFKTTVIIALSVVAILFSASVLMQDKVAGIFLKSLSNKISTRFTSESVRLSFLKKFPRASLELKNVIVFSSPGLDKKSFGDTNTDTLLTGKSVSVDFSMLDIIRGVYNIESAGIKEGTIKLLSDSAGHANYSITVNDAKDSSDDFTINLEKINIADLNAYYVNLATRLRISGKVKDGRLKTKISGNTIDFTADARMEIAHFSLYNFNLDRNIDAVADVTLNSSSEGVTFSKSTLTFDNHKLGLSGTISSDNILDLDINGEDLDLTGIKNFLPEKYFEKITAYNPSGILNIEGKVTGPLTRTENPGIKISFSLDNGSVTYGKSFVKIKDLSFMGNFTNGKLKIPRTSSLSITGIRGMLGSSLYTGSFNISDFSAPRADIGLKGLVVAPEIREFFNLKNITSAKGTIELDLKINGPLIVKDKLSFTDIMNMRPVAELDFNSFGFTSDNEKFMTDNVNGSISLAKNIVARDLIFTYREHNFNLSGTFINLPEWLSGKLPMLTVKADLTCNNLRPELFSVNKKGEGTESQGKRAFIMPRDIVMDINFKINELHYKTLHTSAIDGLMSYKPGIINFKSLNISSLEGDISGDGFFAQNVDRSFIGRGNLAIERVDIKKAFITFNNFGQEFIIAENLEGTLSGVLSLLLPLDSLMKPVIKSLTAEGKYIITNGALVNFEPIKALSKFIELSELENIRFEKLENDFFIRNNNLYIPRMDVKSTAADLAVDGKHDFSNNYEYHVKVELSEILSKKLKKPRSGNTELGAVKDDGLGRTSLLLKVENRGDNVRVGYDIKAAGNEIKSDIKNERKNLRTILNQEYGWFKGDTTVNRKEDSSTPRFKITWEESDPRETEPESQEEQKESPLKNLFRKK